MCTNIMPSLVGVQPQSSGSRLGLQTVASVQSVCNTDELLRRLQQGMDSDAVSVHSNWVRGVVVAHGSAVAQHYIVEAIKLLAATATWAASATTVASAASATGSAKKIRPVLYGLNGVCC